MTFGELLKDAGITIEDLMKHKVGHRRDGICVAAKIESGGPGGGTIHEIEIQVWR